MNEQLLFVALFSVAFLFNKNITYMILMVAAILNAALFSFTNPENVHIESSINFFILLMVMVFGDKHQEYQMGCLIIALLACFQFEVDQLSGSNVVFDKYGAIVTAITIAQLLGSANGVYSWFSKRVRRTNNDRLLYSGPANHMDIEKCQKEQQK